MRQREINFLVYVVAEGVRFKSFKVRERVFYPLLFLVFQVALLYGSSRVRPRFCQAVVISSARCLRMRCRAAGLLLAGKTGVMRCSQARL